MIEFQQLFIGIFLFYISVGSRPGNHEFDDVSFRKNSLASFQYMAYSCDDRYNTRTPVVLDNGSFLHKAGLSTDPHPQVIFPSVVGRPSHPGLVSPGREDNVYVGTDAEYKRNLLKLTYPIQGSSVFEWRDMEDIWRYAIHKQLQLEPSLHPTLLGISPLTSKKEKIKMAEILLESISVPCVSIQCAGVLALHAAGKSEGIVLDSGHSGTYVYAFREQKQEEVTKTRVNKTTTTTTTTTTTIQPTRILHSKIGGQNLTLHLAHLLTRSGFTVTRDDEQQLVQTIKEEHCHVSPQPLRETNNRRQQREANNENREPMQFFELPDGHVITFENNELCKCSELLFDPGLFGGGVVEILGKRGIHELVVEAMRAGRRQTVDAKISTDIIVTGGSTLFPGFETRLQTEVEQLLPQSSVNVKSGGLDAVWRGGARLSELEYCGWLSKREWREKGDRAVREMFL